MLEAPEAQSATGASWHRRTPGSLGGTRDGTGADRLVAARITIQVQPYNLRRLDRLLKTRAPRGLCQVENFVSYASGSLEAQWGEIERELPHTFTAVKHRTALSDSCTDQRAARPDRPSLRPVPALSRSLPPRFLRDLS